MINTLCVATEPSLPRAAARRGPPYPMETPLPRVVAAVWHRPPRKLTGGGVADRADAGLSCRRANTTEKTFETGERGRFDQARRMPDAADRQQFALRQCFHDAP